VTDFTRLFESQFPTVMRMIRDLKRKDYTQLACEMQRTESRIVIHGVCADLMRAHPDVPLVTIHDSVMTTPGNVAAVKDAMREAFARVGIRPTLKVEGSPEAMRSAA
jgi:hypothetical protein